MKLTDLLADADVQVAGSRGDLGAVEIGSVAMDSRAVTRGALFCCVPGAETDGHRYAGEAVRSGAVALLCEHPVDIDVPQVVVATGTIRPALARVAASIFGHPDRAMATAAVTGTNGKTTTAHLLRCVLESHGTPTGLVGTLTGARTTPEAPDLQATLAGFRDGGRRAVVMEVSSHALSQHRVDGIRFDVAAFTNLSHEHLDYHATMESYFSAKARLFVPERCRAAVVDVDGPWGRRLRDQIRGVPVLEVRRSEADGLRLGIDGCRFHWRGHQVAMRLTGAFNVDNALVAAAAATVLGVPEGAVAEGLSSAPIPPGRMDVVFPGPPFAVLVDFAHTPDGLAALLGTARELAGGGRVVCVFGCGGDRDRAKRPLMGATAARLADVVVLTSDNPRSEDPLSIIEEIRAGISGGAEVVRDPDRSRAVAAALTLARTGDVIVVAGKGHESTQEIAGRRLPFDDRHAVLEGLEAIGIEVAR